jgi:glycosyltransferase involved in cell wall biosynthesis
LHIAFFSNGWPPERYPGGINTYISCLRDEFVSQGHRVSIIARNLAEGCDDRDVHVVPNDWKRRLIVRLLDALGIPPVASFGLVVGLLVDSINKKTPIDVLEIEESFGLSLDIKKAAKIPVVVKLHGPAFLTEPQEYRSDPLVQKRLRREGRAMAAIDALMAPSESTLQSTIEFYALQPKIARCVKNPYDITRRPPLWSPETCSHDTLLFVGRFDRMKGGDRALLTFKELLQRYPHLKLLFVGPDNGIGVDGRWIHFDEFVEQLFSKTERAQITNLGVQTTAQIEVLRCKAFATIITSPWENSPYAAIEAMHQACPVVATDAGGVNELIEHGVTGLLARADDIQSLCDQVAALLADNSLGENLGRNARNYVINNHDPSRLASETLEVYKLAIASNERRKRARSASSTTGLTNE